ncbi:MAG: hypothetical protein ACI85O_003361 [Saprospiraceae bacterium]|jgi:hypothetical protein
MDTQKQNRGKDEAELFAQFKCILLKDERQEIQKIEETIQKQENLSKEISPIVEEHIELLKNNFPNEFKVVVDKMIAKKKSRFAR